VERARLLEGNWKVRFDSGTVFNRAWFNVIAPVYAKIGRVVRFWDIAATAKEMAKAGTYYTAGVKMTKFNDIYTVLDVTAKQVGAGNVEAYIMAIAQQDGKEVKIRWEQEGGSAGILWCEQLRKRLQALGFDADYIKPQGDKVSRATPYATDASNGKVFVLQSHWTDEYLGCLQRFDGTPQPLVNDYTDASSGAHTYLNMSGVLVSPHLPEQENSPRKLRAIWD
jgi:predicted phage terminase large subunit-like protein